MVDTVSTSEIKKIQQENLMLKNEVQNLHESNLRLSKETKDLHHRLDGESTDFRIISTLLSCVNQGFSLEELLEKVLQF
jgi:hypothetical protein